MHAQTLRLPDSLHRRTRVIAAASGCTQTAFIRRAITNELTRAAEDDRLLSLVFTYLRDEAGNAGH